MANKKRTKEKTETVELTEKESNDTGQETIAAEYVPFENDHTLTAKVSVNDHNTVVICMPDDAHKTLLPYVLRSLEQNLRMPANVVIIGNPEGLFSEDIEVIPFISSGDQSDVVEMLKLAIADERITDKFVCLQMPVFFVSPVVLADIEVFKIPASNAIPVCYEKEKLVTLFEENPDIVNWSHLHDLYLRTYLAGFIPLLMNWKEDIYMLPVVSPSPDFKKMDEMLKRKKFLYLANSSLSDKVIGKVKEMFPTGFSFENEG